ncbi:MAG: polysaccharide biosynthesis C-terminal domain-containing protein [Crocinitomicaceae bacterium]|nr:polysaccharide biosynthesis C-terminal domain-containing protein [Crocinitomicaceae bacterium]
MGQVKRDSIINTIITYLGIGLGYLNKGLLFPILLLPEQVGLVNVIMLLAGFFAQFSNLGTGMILLRFLPFLRDEKYGYSGVLHFTVTLLFGGILVMSLILIVGNDWILSYFEDNSPALREYWFWILPAGIAGAFYILFEAYLRGISKNIISVFFQDFVLRILVFATIIGFWLDWYSFDTFIIAFFCAHFVPAIALVIYLIYIGQFFVQRKYLIIRRRMRRMMLSYGAFVYFNAFGRNIILMADATMLAAISGLETVAVFTIMVFLSNAIFVPYVSLLRISAPFVPKYWKERNMIKMKSMYTRVTSIGFFVTFLLFSIVWLNIDYLLTYLPDVYATGKYMFLFLMIGRLFDSIGGINGDILLTSKKYKWEVYITIPLIVLTITLNYFLIPNYGGIGAAVATCMVYFCYNVIRLLINHFTFNLQPFTWSFVLMVLMGTGMLTIGIFIPSLENPLLNIMLMTAIPLLLFMTPVLGLKLVPEVNGFLGQVLRRIVPDK